MKMDFFFFNAFNMLGGSGFISGFCFGISNRPDKLSVVQFVAWLMAFLFGFLALINCLIFIVFGTAISLLLFVGNYSVGYLGYIFGVKLNNRVRP
jgi:hypothetical protein